MNNKANQYKISKNFSLFEFLCKCNQCVYSDPNIDPDLLVKPSFIEKLQCIRDEVGKPLKINSGARCVRYNAEVGGAGTSAHMVTVAKPCEAADISVVGFSSPKKWLLVRSAYKHLIWGIGIYSNFVHLDSKQRKAIWHGKY